MALEFKKAKRSQVAIKIGIGGPSGSGKTMSSLLLAYGLVKAEHPEWSDEECWDKICIIDTENGSGSLYTGESVGETHIGEYNTIDMAPPFTPVSFIDRILLRLESAGLSSMDILISMKMKHPFPMGILMVVLVNFGLYAITDLIAYGICRAIGTPFSIWYGPVIVSALSLVVLYVTCVFDGKD